MTIELGNTLELRRRQEASAQRDRYAKYDPRISDLSWYFYNVFYEKEGSIKYAPLIGEQANAITAFVAFVMGDAPVMIKSWSGSGKSILAKTIETLVPDEMRYEIDMGSAMGPWYQNREINESSYVFFPEFQNSGDNKEVEKILKKWGEGAAARRSRADVTRSNAEEDATIDRVLECKPFFTTLAVENKTGASIWNEEFGRRVIDLYTDVSEDQTRRVVQYMLEVYENGVKTMANMPTERKEMLLYHIRQCITIKNDLVKEYRFPAASQMLNQVPTKFVQSRSALPLLIKVMNSFSVFNYKNRIITEDGILLVAPEDLYLAWACYGKRFAQKCFNMEMLADELLQIFPKVKNPETPTRREQLNEREIKIQLKTLKINITKQKLTKLLESFVDAGILDTERSPEIQDETLYYRTGIDDFDQTFDYRQIIEHCKEAIKTQYPKYASEYIARFCTNPVVEHPFKPYKESLLNRQDRHDIVREWKTFSE